MSTATVPITLDLDVPVSLIAHLLHQHVLATLTTNGSAPLGGHLTTNGHAATPTQEDAAPVLPSSTGAP